MSTKRSGRKRSATGSYIANHANEDVDNNDNNTKVYKSRRRDGSSPSLSNSEEMSDGNNRPHSRSRSQSQSQEYDDGKKSKSASLSPQQKVVDDDAGDGALDDTLEQLGDLWSENDIYILMKLVYTNKSLEVSKLFPDGISLAAPVSGADNHYSRSMAETKALLERLAESTNYTSGSGNSGTVGSSSSAGSTKNACDRGELLAILASERAFIRRERMECKKMLESYKKLKADEDAIISGTKMYRMLAQRAMEQYTKETILSKKALEDKRNAEKDLVKAQEELSRTREEHSKYTTELNTGRLNALETRRKLDKIRLKIAATRGEMVVKPTMEAEEEYFVPREIEIETAGKDGNNADANDNDNDNDDGNNDKDGNDEVEKMEDLDMDKEKDEDTDVNMEVEGKESGNDRVKKNDDDDIDNDNNGAEKEEEDMDADIGFDEDALATEIRLLKNRLNMYDTEVQEWEDSLEAMKRQKNHLLKANGVLALELERSHSTNSMGMGIGNGIGNMYNYTGTKRRGGAGDENYNFINNGTNEKGEGEEKRKDGEQEDNVKDGKKRSRKGIPMRRITGTGRVEVGEGVKVA